ncbi:hypothetical protein KIN20_036441 [Parelaphostrongylus tenuis]|uniref:Uncharacterized protein n=1 Tax=Parelaphostrongylus tenuis TaxID=148309 RepID=A0AAD5RD64_PARTN|nr:hypothetical protein KIN20_036441 [Parelaphostrongylus tenuis]
MFKRNSKRREENYEVCDEGAIADFDAQLTCPSKELESCINQSWKFKMWAASFLNNKTALHKDWLQNRSPGGVVVARIAGMGETLIQLLSEV